MMVDNPFLDWKPKRKPICPECGQEMELCQTVDHYYWTCHNHSSATHYGIKGQGANFQFAKLVDPVTLEIVDNVDNKQG